MRRSSAPNAESARWVRLDIAAHSVHSVRMSSPNHTDAEERFEAWRRRIGFILGPVVFLVLLAVPMPGLSPQAHALAAILGLTIVFWMSECIPMAATALLGPALCVVLGVAKDDAVFASFGHKIVLLFIGSFLLAEAMKKHGLEKRIAYALLDLPGVAKSPARIIAAFGILTALLSMWMSNTAVTAVMLPIGLGVLRANPQLGARRDIAASLVLMIAFSASIGGLATPVGTPTNLVAVGQLERALGVRVSFFDWMRLAVPLAACLLVALFFIVRPRHMAASDFSGVREAIAAGRSQLGPMTLGERNAAVAFFLAVGLWMYPGLVELTLGKGKLGAAFLAERLPEETVGLVAGLILFLMPTDLKKWEFTLDWRDGARIDWGTVLLFGGGLALGKQIFDTGLAKAIGDGVIAMLGSPTAFSLMLVAVIMSVLLSEATSNTASANVMVPMMIAVSQSADLAPVPIAIATCLACSFGFMLPISTPPNALAYGTGLVRIPQMMLSGLWLDLAGIVAVLLIMHFFAPLLGWE
jgi:sodium-dependent dicarboxylate transporter 2/3/5